MISPELLRRYPFFGSLTDAQLRQVAMITNEHTYERGEVIFCEEQFAEAMYLLREGSIDLIFSNEAKGPQEKHNEYLVGEINPGEAFGVSAVIEPYRYAATARASEKCCAIRVEAAPLIELMKADQGLACHVLQQSARAFAERLRYTCIQLAAARA